MGCFAGEFSKDENTKGGIMMIGKAWNMYLRTIVLSTIEDIEKE